MMSIYKLATVIVYSVLPFYELHILHMHCICTLCKGGQKATKQRAFLHFFPFRGKCKHACRADCVFLVDNSIGVERFLWLTWFTTMQQKM